MPVKDRYVAFGLDSENECNECLDVRLVSKEEQNALKNQCAKARAKKEQEKKEHKELHKNIDEKLEHFDTLQCVLAKSIYDNFVDRGLIENDDQFQQMWYDFYFNGGLFNTENAPKEYKDILKKVVSLWEIEN